MANKVTNCDYPLYSQYYDKHKLEKIFESIKKDTNVHINISDPKSNTKYNNKNVIYRIKHFYDHVSVHDFFTENYRIHTKCQNMSNNEYELFCKPENKQKFLNIYYDTKSLDKAKQLIKKQLGCKYEIYSVDLFYKLYRTYKPFKILDGLTKYGEGLMASLAYGNLVYTNINDKNIFASLNEAAKRFKSNDQTIKFIENIEGSNKYDMIMTTHKNVESFIDILDEHGWLFIFGESHDSKIRNHKNISLEGTVLYTIDNAGYSQINVYYKKPQKITREIYNPLPIIKKVQSKNRTFNIIRDDYLSGGTKQRGAVPYFSDILKNKPTIKELIYRGPSNGVAQVALGVIAKLYGLKATVILNKERFSNDYTDLTKNAIMWGVNVILIDRPQSEKEEHEIISKIYTNPEIQFNVPLGFDTDDFRDYLATEITKTFGHLNVKYLWLTSTTGNLLRPFYRVFPDSRFGIVLPGFKHTDYVNKDNTDIYEAPEKYREQAKYPPPYPSAQDYDAKLWQFVDKYGKDGDYVLNVA